MDYIIDFIVLGIIYFIFFYRRWRKEDKQKFIVKTLIYIYISFVLFFTLMPFLIPIPGGNNLFLQSMNLVPFRDVIKGINGAVREAILNIIMLIPLGFLLPIVRKRNVITITLFSLLFSLSIELIQLLYIWSAGPTSRIFDVTDLINNTIGGIIGYLIYLIFRPLINKVLKQIK